MALLQSNPFAIGTPAPNFTLLDTVSNIYKSLAELQGEHGTVIMFICNHCPFVLLVNNGLVKLANDYLQNGIAFIAISSNDVVHYPEDGPALMKKVAVKYRYPFVYLYDETQDVAKAYDATCTPDYYIFDADLKAVYHGQLDNARPGNGIAVTGVDIRNALDKLLKKQENDSVQKPSIGCGIKWK
jgi:peroxiredoxin